MFKVLAVFALIFVSVNAFWTACDGNLPSPTSLTSPSCSGASCTVTRGNTLVATIAFTPTSSSSATNLPVEITAYFLGTTFPFDVSAPHNNACNQLSPGCPISAGTSRTWTLNFEIPTDVPAISGHFTFAIRDGGNFVTCANVTATLN